MHAYMVRPNFNVLVEQLKNKGQKTIYHTCICWNAVQGKGFKKLFYRDHGHCTHLHIINCLLKFNQQWAIPARFLQYGRWLFSTHRCNRLHKRHWVVTVYRDNGDRQSLIPRHWLWHQPLPVKKSGNISLLLFLSYFYDV